LLLFVFEDTLSVKTTIDRGENMQVCHSLRCQHIDMSTADLLVSIFRNNAGTPLQNNNAALK